MLRMTWRGRIYEDGGAKRVGKFEALKSERRG